MNRVKANVGRAIHVGVNAHLLSLAESYRSAGINWYIYNLLRHLPEADPEIRFTVFLSERRYSASPGLQVQLSRLPTHRPPVRILWEQALQPWALRSAGVELVHGPAFVGPLLGSVPSVVTVHDLSFLLYPEGFRKPNRLYLTSFTRRSVQQARRVIAVSDSTKRDVVRLYGISPDKVDVVHNGVDPCFQPLPASEIAAFRAKQGLPERFLLFVGTLEPRKNVVRLIEAYAQLPADRPPLMLVGGKGWLYDEIFARVETLGLGDRCALLALSLPRISQSGTTPPPCLSTLRSTRVLACLPWKRWPVAPRSSPPQRRHCPRSWARPACWWTPPIPRH